jgi:carboxypeptidase family protein
MLTRFASFALSIYVLFLFVPVAIGQTASLSGTITDSSGALVPHVKVIVVNASTNISREVESGSSGVYTIVQLTPGRYEVTFDKSGFKTVKFTAIELTVDQKLTLDTKLEVSSAAEQITVEGAVVPIDTTDAQVSNVVEHQQMTELPLILRDPYQLVLLGPGVTQSDNMGGVSVNGGRERNNNFMLDGADNNDAEDPGNLGGLTAQNPDSTQEFRVITNNFAPEYGRNNGAIIDVVTRSGSNTLHGDAFYFGRWDALGARDYFNHQIDPATGLVAPKNPYVRNLYGTSLGGSLIKNKTFFFVNYQGDRFVTNLTNTSVVPTATFKSGVFTYTNPNTGASQAIDLTTAGNGNNGTGVGLDPVMQQILSLYPAPNQTNADGVSGQLFFPSESREKDEDATLKIDQKISKGNSFSARYIYNWFHDPNPAHTDFLPGGLGAVAEFGRTQGLALVLASNPSPTLFNELRASANRINANFACTGTGTFNSFGFIDQVGRGADFFLPGYSGFGCLALSESDGQGRRSGTYQYSDALTKVMGRHTMKVGGEFRNVYSNNFTDFSSRALFLFNNFSTFGVPVLQNLNPNVDSNFLEDNSSMLLGLVTAQLQTQFFSREGARQANDELDFRQRELGVFAQDQWKVLPNLTLTYGLRWEYYGVPFEAGGNLATLFTDPSGAAPFNFTAVGPGTGRQLFQSYYRNFEPRLGFAWDPLKKGKTSIRGGIGGFSDRVYGNLVSDARGNPPFQPSVVNLPIFTSGLGPGTQLQAQTAPAQLTPSPTVTQGSEIFPDLFATNLKPPSLVSWNLGIQHQLASSLTLEINYIGNHGTRILRVVDGNPPQPGLLSQLEAFCVPGNPSNTGFDPAFDPGGNGFAPGQCSPATLQRNNLYQGAEEGALPFDAVNNNAFLHAFVDQTSAHSWYNGLQAQVTERAFRGLQIQMSYTWSHAMDDASDPLPGAVTINNVDFPVDSFHLNREIGNSGFDTRQRAALNFVYQPNIGRGKSYLSGGFVGRVFEGWEISGIAAFQTGLPYDIFGPLDTTHNGAPNGVVDRATVINPAALKTVPATGKTFQGGVFTGFNPAAFNLEDDPATIPWGVQSSVVRNNWYGPGVNNWDMALNKTTALTERIKLQFRFEIYNVFNRVQFAKPNNTTASPQFGYSFQQVGQNDGTTGARQLQLGAKVTF